MKDKDYLKRVTILDCSKAMLPAILFYCIETITNNYLSIYTTQIMGGFTDAMFNLDVNLGMETLKKILLCIALVVLLVPFLGYIAEMLMFSNALKHDRIVLKRFFQKSYQEAMKIDEGEVQYRMENDVNEFRQKWVDIVIGAISFPVILVYLLYHVLRVSIWFSLVILAILALKLSVPILLKKIRVQYDKETREYKTKVRVLETEISTKPYAVKMYGLKESFIQKLDEIYCAFYKNTFVKKTVADVISNQVNDFLDSFCILLILLIGSIIVANGILTPGAVVAMTGYFAIFNTVIKKLWMFFNEVPLLQNLHQRMQFLYDGREERAGMEVEEFHALSAEDLSYSYGENLIFKGLGFRICAGEKVAVCGENGSGKTTLIRLISTLNAHYKGSLKVDGIEFSALDIDGWRKQIAYVPQQPYLFSMSVRENVWLGNREISEKQLDEILSDVGITYLGEREVSMDNQTLSGGERQKIAIARAIAKDAQIILLDEPDNHLDIQSFHWLTEFIKQTKKTVLFISHESQLLEAADKIIRLQ